MNLRHAAGAALVVVAGAVAAVGFTHYHAMTASTASPLAGQALASSGAGSANNTSTANNSLIGLANNTAASVPSNSPSSNSAGDQNPAGSQGDAASGASAGNGNTAGTGNTTGSGASAKTGTSTAANLASTRSTSSSTVSGSTGSTAKTSSGSTSGHTSTNTSTSNSSSGGHTSTSSTAASSPSLGTFTIIVSENKGTKVLEKKVETIHSGESLLDYMNQDFQITTDYNGQFITSIDGIKSLWTGVSASERQPVDWFLYVNGQEAPVGAGSIMPQSGDVDTWDYHSWNVSTGRG